MSTKYFYLIAFLLILAGCQSEHKSKQTQSLAGEWTFRLDPHDVGADEQWYKQTFTDKIKLPGSLQEQGYGYDVDIHTQWTGQIVDSAWYTAPAYEKYRKPGNIKVPFWLNPEKHYVGVAWYQKEIDVPAGWKGAYLQFEMERTHWGTTLYIDDEEMERQDGLSTPHSYSFKATPGKHTLTVRVDNRVHIPVGINAHSVSDHTQSNWNGIIGRITLSKQPVVFIHNVQVYPDIKTRQIRVKVRGVNTIPNNKHDLKMHIETLAGEPISQSVNIHSMDKGSFTVDTVIGAGADALLWSEHSPNLYRLKTVIVSGGEKDERLTTFGFREFKKEGTRFHINGQPTFLRGTLECCIFPLTGYPATDGGYWEKIYNACKDFGLNHVRFHSWCPPRAAFEVADSMGIYLQVECGAWARIGDGDPIDQWIQKEGDRILETYGNHPSFCMMAYGNEPDGSNQVAYLSGLVEYWQKKDPRRVYTSAAGWPYVANADFWNAPEPRIQHWGAGLKSILNAEPPRSDFDFSEIIQKDMPTVSHEIGQWCVYPNLNEIGKYSGVLKAKNFEIFKETLTEKNMADLADAFLYASGRLQTLCYKADIEAALRTPGMAGFQLLDLHDFPGQGTALVGVLDPFWDTKGYVDGKEYSTFCNQTVPLIRFPKMIWLNNERMNVPIEMAHFGDKPLKDAGILWSITTQTGRELSSGRFKQDIPIGNGIAVGSIDFGFQSIREPAQLTVSVAIENTPYKNQWNIWVYPVQKPALQNRPYITSRLDQAAINRLGKGEQVLLTLPRGSVLPEKGGNIPVGFSSIFWNTAWTRGQAPHTLGILCNPTHPALAAFPNQGHSDYQWWEIVSDCDALLMDDFPPDFRPIIHLIDDWFTNRKLGILFEAKVGKGKLMVCSVDLEKDLHKRPAVAQFRQSILEYMGSEGFNPDKEIRVDLVKALLK